MGRLVEVQPGVVAVPLPIMRVLVAPNAFKESLTARGAARAMAAGVRRACRSARVEELPVADGGDGTLDALGLPVRRTWARDPLGRYVRARYGFDPVRRLAAVELAEASGLWRLDVGERNPLATSTEGTGDLLRAALEAGAREVVLGLGGSATVEAATGALRVLGVRFLDRRGRDLPPGGAALETLARIEAPSPLWRGVRFRVACDVTNPLLGPRGAAPVFGPQKGAGPAAVRRLGRGLAAFARAVRTWGGPDVSYLRHGGAAGGAAAAFHALLGAELADGAELILSLVKFDARARGADLVLTGEGRLDPTTTSGKAPVAVARHGARLGVPVIALCGERACALSATRRMGFSACLAILPGPASREEALSRAGPWLEEAAAQAVSIFLSGRRSWRSR